MNAMQGTLPVEAGKPLSVAAWLVIVLISLAGLSMVADIAWVTEDSFYTLRYVQNTLAGYGAVFNVGDYVQAYTHPLWFLLLLAGSFVFGDPVLVAIGLGLLLTLVFLVGFGVAIHRAVDDSVNAALIFALAVGVLVSAEAWLTFQTSGLENALANCLLLLVVCECFFNRLQQPARIVLLLTLLCLCRPDYVWFALPLGLAALRQLAAARNLVGLFLSILPGLLWLGFAASYYGYPLPNTASAKLGIYASFGAAVNQGLTYVIDWVTHDIAAAVATAVGLLTVLLVRKDAASKLLVTGVLLQLLWVIASGGDFMRGRFLVAVLVATTVLAALALAGRYAQQVRPQWGSLVTVALTFTALAAAGHVLRPPSISGVVDDSGIVNERLFYPGYTLATYLQLGRPDAGPDMTDNVAMLADYIAACGPVAVHWRNPATIGYMVGPQATLIDTLGLADRYIAALPATLLVSENPRPGHPDKYIPVSYLAERGDVAIVEGWLEKMRAHDCSLGAAAASLAESELFITPENQIVRLSFSD